MLEVCNVDNGRNKNSDADTNYHECSVLEIFSFRL